MSDALVCALVNPLSIQKGSTHEGRVGVAVGAVRPAVRLVGVEHIFVLGDELGGDRGVEGAVEQKTNVIGRLQVDRSVYQI